MDRASRCGREGYRFESCRGHQLLLFMGSIKLSLATEKDKSWLLEHFKHYGVEEIVKGRVDCYLSHGFTVIAKDGERIVGVLQWYVKEDPKKGLVEFEEVYVLEGDRGKGIGSLILEYAVDSVRGYFRKIKIRPRRIFLFVARDNKPARTLYEKFGFELVAEVGCLFSDNEIDLLYSLEL